MHDKQLNEQHLPQKLDSEHHHMAQGIILLQRYGPLYVFSVQFLIECSSKSPDLKEDAM